MKHLALERIVGEKKNLERVLDNLAVGIIAHDKKRRVLPFSRLPKR